jgi:hypothetical protein
VLLIVVRGREIGRRGRLAGHYEEKRKEEEEREERNRQPLI